MPNLACSVFLLGLFVSRQIRCKPRKAMLRPSGSVLWVPLGPSSFSKPSWSVKLFQALWIPLGHASYSQNIWLTRLRPAFFDTFMLAYQLKAAPL